MKDNLLAITLIILIILNAFTFFIFGNLFVEIWDDAMNSNLITRNDFDTMVLRGFIFITNTVFTVFLFGFIYGKHGLKKELS